MDETDILLTIAEIGVALAGFASLAAILGRRYKHTDPLVNAIRLRGLLDAGLSTMLLALIGVLMLQIGGSSRWVWQGSGIAGLVFVSAIGTAAFRREKLRRLRRLSALRSSALDSSATSASRSISQCFVCCW
jgi:hypothetical protein